MDTCRVRRGTNTEYRCSTPITGPGLVKKDSNSTIQRLTHDKAITKEATCSCMPVYCCMPYHLQLEGCRDEFAAFEMSGQQRRQYRSFSTSCEMKDSDMVLLVELRESNQTGTMFREHMSTLMAMLNNGNERRRHERIGMAVG